MLVCGLRTILFSRFVHDSHKPRDIACKTPASSEWMKVGKGNDLAGQVARTSQVRSCAGDRAALEQTDLSIEYPDVRR
jgi:hypothetical protein